MKCPICNIEMEGAGHQEYFSSVLFESHYSCDRCQLTHETFCGSTRMTVGDKEFIWGYRQTEEDLLEESAFNNLVNQLKKKMNHNEPSGWISVKDAKPDLGKPVHFIFSGKVYSGAFKVEHSTWEDPTPYTAYYWDTVEETGGIEEDDVDQVTHWMYQHPLPFDIQ